MTNVKTIRLKEKNITDFAQARNKLIEKNYDWNLFLDSDEELSGLLPKLDKKYNYAFKRIDWFLGQRLKFGETASVKLTRLIQPGSGKWAGKVHEEFISDKPIKTSSVKILHRRQITLSQFIDRLNWYSSLRAQELNKFSLFELLFYPPLKFVKNYFFLLGFLDGAPGLIMSLMMSLHSLWVRIKVYEQEARK